MRSAMTDEIGSCVGENHPFVARTSRRHLPTVDLIDGHASTEQTGDAMNRTVKSTVIAGLMVAASTATGGAQDGQGTIRLGQVGLSFYAVVGGVVQELLEREGYTVEVVEGPHAEIFPRLGAGEVDILAAAWLPGGHAALYEPVQDETFRIAPLYEDARFFWVVPSYVPESAVASIEDLADPDVRARMPERIVSLPEATGLTVGARRVMDAYGLEDAGYTLVAGSPADWLGTFSRGGRERGLGRLSAVAAAMGERGLRRPPSG